MNWTVGFSQSREDTFPPKPTRSSTGWTADSNIPDWQRWPLTCSTSLRWQRERVFSAAGCMVMKRRTRLGTDVISAAQTIRSWVKAGLMDDYDGIALRDAGIGALEDEISQQIESGTA
ncbi:hypothetical protein N658DRAFT_103394 [Parathielavia hyrcaniae]|uniref:Uncharacterized protein n=1 Tax=Parathielavia hyrcaniae TaxID=113614 RepID=A0AAN6PYS0_9PEZI|nr:hypothetical protein N658DRAFT_103394 [Parathielavia hyrcaniae]